LRRASLAAGRFGGGAPHAITSSASESSSWEGVGVGDWGAVEVDGMGRDEGEEVIGTWV